MMNFAFPRKFDNRIIIVVMDSSYTTQIVLIFESSPLEDRRVRRAKLKGKTGVCCQNDDAQKFPPPW